MWRDVEEIDPAVQFINTFLGLVPCCEAIGI